MLNIVKALYKYSNLPLPLYYIDVNSLYNLDVATAWVNALVGSRLDYSTPQLHSIPTIYHNKIQLVENFLAIATTLTRFTNSRLFNNDSSTLPNELALLL